MHKFEFLKDATIYREYHDEVIYKNEKGEFFRFSKEIADMEILKESEDRMLLGRKGRGTCMISKTPTTETMLGEYVVLNKHHTEEQLEVAREAIIDLICEGIRKTAKEIPEMVFIEKEFTENGKEIKTVACKIVIPVPMPNNPIVIGGSND